MIGIAQQLLHGNGWRAVYAEKNGESFYEKAVDFWVLEANPDDPLDMEIVGYRIIYDGTHGCAWGSDFVIYLSPTEPMPSLDELKELYADRQHDHEIRLRSLSPRPPAKKDPGHP